MLETQPNNSRYLYQPDFRIRTQRYFSHKDVSQKKSCNRERSAYRERVKVNHFMLLELIQEI